ncbi:MAG: alanine racemase [Pseudomonadota bacterium]
MTSLTTIHPDLAGGRLTIDLAALRANYRLLRQRAGAAECAAVVKADAYGCGIEPVVHALLNEGCKTFFVALPTEGMRVRAVAPDAAIHVLNGLFEGAEAHLIETNLMPVLGSVREIELWVAAAQQAGRALPCALHMDSGMNRLGLTLAELRMVTGRPAFMDHLDVRLFATHFACADDVDHPKTAAQREAFEQASALLPGVPRSAANSAADLQMAGLEFEMVRAGIALYGGEALNHVSNPCQPVAKLEGRIIQIRTSAAGEAVGYGASETLKRKSRIAYVSVGYADGYHRAASHMGVPMRAVAPAVQGAYNGRLINGIGRISMDMSAFDVTDIPDDEIGPGDWIELFGPTIPVDDVARAAGTIGYELLTGLGHRYHRIYEGER